MTDEEKLISKKESARKWREKNKDYIKEKNKKYNSYYYFKNKKAKVTLSEEEKLLRKKESARKWREKNKEYYSKYRSDNFEKISKYQKEYQKINKEELNKKIQIRKKGRYQSDVKYRLKTLIRTMIKKAFIRNGVSKKSTTTEILGCTFDEFKLHIESKFETWMSWENYGLYNGELNYGWDIDHITPLSSAKNTEELIELNHYTNLQPLCGKVNRNIKKDSMYYEMA